MGRTLGLVLALLAAAGVRAADAPTVEQWRAVELTLTSERDHARPFEEVEVTATFTGPAGQRLDRPAFWDGGRTWRVRFAPTAPGAWTWTTLANDPADAGLHGQHGRLRCVPYAGELPVYRHGFLRVADDHRHLAYRDGTPFFWLADTHWLWEKERLEEANKPGWTSEFRGMADRRLAQGFTVYQVELFGAWQRAPGGGTTLNLEHFQRNVDPKWQYLADHGLVTAATLGILPRTGTAERGARDVRLARYVCARYGAYPSVWLTYQECTASFAEQFQGEADQAAYLDVVRAVATSFQRADGYHHPHTAHSDAFLLTEFRGEPWLDFTLFQYGHGQTVDRTRYYDWWFDPAVTLPQIEGEANYEHLFDRSDTNPRGVVTTDQMREKAWQAMQCGCAGYGYGANGVWQANWGDEHAGNAASYGRTPWAEGIDLPGGEQMRHLGDFYTALPWPELRPRPECDGVLTWDGNVPTRQHPAVATDGPLNTVVVYFYRGTPFTGSLHHLRNVAYTARWYNPRTGETTSLGSITPRAGAWRYPAQPDDQDWVLALTAASAASEPVLGSRYPEVRAAREAERARNVAPKAKATANSTDWGNQVYDPRNAIDGRADTGSWHHWSNDGKDRPTPEKPVWLRLDWDTPQTLTKLVLYTMQGYEVQDYAFEWLDGDTWRGIPGTAVTGNSDDRREHVLATPITTRAIRFVGRKGPARQPEVVRVVEIEALTR